MSVSKKDVLFIIGDWKAKVGNQETPGVTRKFGLGVQNGAGQKLSEFFQEKAPVIGSTLFQQHKRRLYTWTSPVVNAEIRKQESSRETSISALLTMPKPLTVWITINCGKF